MSEKEWNILGLDPANKCGWAHSCGKFGVWNLKKSSDRHSGRRLKRLSHHLVMLSRKVPIEAIGFEDASFGSKHAHVQSMHNELRGIIKWYSCEWDVPIFSFKPTTLKKWLTGNGRADKSEMIKAVARRFGMHALDDNEADAIAVMQKLKHQLINEETKQNALPF